MPQQMHQQYSGSHQQGYKDDAHDESEDEEEEYSSDDDDDDDDDEEDDEDDDDDADDEEEDDEDESEEDESDSDDIEASGNAEKTVGNAGGYPYSPSGHAKNAPLNPSMEASFQEYMQTAEGRMAMETEQNRLEHAIQLQQISERRKAERNAKYDPAKKKGKKTKRTFAMAAGAVLATATAVFSSIGSMFSSPKKKKRSVRGSGGAGLGKKGQLDLEGGATGTGSEIRPAASATQSTSSTVKDRRPKRTAASGSDGAPQGHGQGPPQGPPNAPPNRFRHDVVGDATDTHHTRTDEEEGEEDSSDDETGSGSVSSDDSDVKVVRAPLLPEWVSWKGITTNVGSFFTKFTPDAPPVDGSTPPSSVTPSHLLEIVSSNSIEAARRFGKPVVETIQFALKQTGAGVAVVAGSVWGHLNAALQRYVEGTIDSNGSNARRDRELAIAPTTTRDAMAP
jgi:hypothetical protein